ncbi:MAG: hydroxylamine reductase [Deltaproteobacteria bacterium]|jgi:hydroxylamine reductase|nr:hydroxylamine reductase [Deltaproteobacteria bacterium]
MFCFQCEETHQGTGCLKSGVCGKTELTASLSDLLLRLLKELAAAGLASGKPDRDRGFFLARGLYSTVTNVKFDPESYGRLIDEAWEQFRSLAGGRPAGPGTAFSALPETASLEEKAGLGRKFALHGPFTPAASLKETVLYGLKGLAAYAYHARTLDFEDDTLWSFLDLALAESLKPNLTLDGWLNLALQTGGENLKALELLDRAHRTAFGAPAPVRVSLGFRKGPAVLISGHDLNILAGLLPQAEEAGVSVYTHGEMLPAHGYPGLRSPALAGHFGTAWPNQRRELPEFPGPAVFTSNCLTPPKGDYIERLFTAGLCAFPQVRHLAGNPAGACFWSQVLAEAKKNGGFRETAGGPSVWSGWGWGAVLAEGGKIAGLIRQGRIKNFLLAGGCDGSREVRNSYRELVKKAPPETVVLTLGCGKFRFLDLDLGEIEGIPRLLDLGQCNDAFSAVKILQGLSQALETPVSDLPVQIAVSWYEQKAAAILLSLLHLGIRNISLGPSRPAFLHPEIMKTLADSFGLKAALS